MKRKTHKLAAIYECELVLVTELYPRRDHNKFYYFSDKEIIKRFIMKFTSTSEKLAQDPLLRRMILLLKNHASR